MKYYHKCEKCGEYTIPKRSLKQICKSCENQQKIEQRTVICKSCGKAFVKKSINAKSVYCDMCKTNGKCI